MGLIAGALVPHPPILLPEIGGSRLNSVQQTRHALNELKTALSNVELFIFSSPHTPILASGFAINVAPALKSSFSEFGFSNLNVSLPSNIELAQFFIDALIKDGLPIEATYSTSIDWGVSVPYSYIASGKPVISTSISSLPLEYHFNFGKALASACKQLELPVAFIASGDLSHRLSPAGPYGFSAKGAVFDGLIKNIFSSGQLQKLLNIDLSLASEAGECGLRPLAIMAGVFAETPFKSQLLSYEAPFGIGYLVGLLTAVSASEVINNE